MAKFLILTCLIVVFISGYSSAQHTGKQIVIGTTDTVYSTILNEKRTVWVHVPQSNGVKQRYPVLYLLDGEDHFYSATGILKQLSGVLPDMIIVGITNTIRSRDLTPTLAKSNIHNADDVAASGGGDNFMGFIEKELMPHIDSAYPTTPYKVFSGHSLGGLTVINTFLNNTNLFNAYIALDPSLWWDNQKLAADVEQVALHKKFDNKALFIGIANHMQAGMDTTDAQKDTTGNSVLTRAVLKFVHELNGTGNSGLRLGYKYYPEERHGTVELIGEYDALRYLFNYYQFKTSMFELNPALDVDSAVDMHFKRISAMFGYPVYPSEDLINNLAYTCMGNKKMEQAYRLFKLNIDNYPTSGNAFDSMGDYYDAVGDTKKAMESYAKSLSLQETADTRRKYELMKAKK